MEIRQIKELMATMSRTGLKKLTLKKADFELTLERQDIPADKVQNYLLTVEEDTVGRTQSTLQHAASLPITKTKEMLPQTHETPKQEETAGVFVTSPMVGTFYSSPSPEHPSFVKVGDKIEKNSVVCIIEAMKVMNEIKAGVSGIVQEILIDNGQPVEFGSKLFRIG